MKHDNFPSSGGLKLVILPTLYQLEEQHLLHPDIMWWTYKQALGDEAEIPCDVRHVVICGVALAQEHQKTLTCRAYQSGVEEVFVVNDLNSIMRWAETLLVPDKDDSRGWSVDPGLVDNLIRSLVMDGSVPNLRVSPGMRVLIAGNGIYEIARETPRNDTIIFWDIPDINRSAEAPEQVALANVQTVAIVQGHMSQKQLDSLRSIARSKGITDFKYVQHKGMVRQLVENILAQQVGGNGGSHPGDPPPPPPPPPNPNPPPPKGQTEWSMAQFVRDNADFNAKPASKEIGRLVKLAKDSGHSEATFSGASNAYYLTKRKMRQGQSVGSAPQSQKRSRAMAKVIDSLYVRLQTAIKNIDDGIEATSAALAELRELLPQVKELEDGNADLTKQMAAMRDVEAALIKAGWNKR